MSLDSLIKVGVIVVAVSMAFMCLSYFFVKKNKDNVPVSVVVMLLAAFLILAVGSIATISLALKPTESADGQIINLQGITLTLTGAAVALVTIILGLKNYDYEQKAKETEKQIQEKMNQFNNASNSIETLNKRVNINVRLLFDSNSTEDAHLLVRIANYEQILTKYMSGSAENDEQDKENITVALALIDALTQKAANEGNTDRIKDYKEIYDYARHYAPLAKDKFHERINLEIKQANAAYQAARLLHICEDDDSKKEAEIYINDARSILLDLQKEIEDERKNKDVPKDLASYISGYLGLYTFWCYNILKEEKSLEKSIEYYEKCLEKHPNNTRMLNNLAISEEHLVRNSEKSSKDKIEEYKKIQEIYKKAITIDPDRQQGWRNIAASNREILHLMLGVDLNHLDELKIPVLDKEKTEEVRSVKTFHIHLHRNMSRLKRKYSPECQQSFPVSNMSQNDSLWNYC